MIPSVGSWQCPASCYTEREYHSRIRSEQIFILIEEGKSGEGERNVKKIFALYGQPLKMESQRPTTELFWYWPAPVVSGVPTCMVEAEDSASPQCR